MPSEEEEIINLIAQELMAGKNVNTVAGELMQAGLPRDEAFTVVNAVSQQIAARGGGAPRGGGGGGGARMAPPRKRGLPWTYIFLVLAILVLGYILLYK